MPLKADVGCAEAPRRLRKAPPRLDGRHRTARGRAANGSTNMEKHTLMSGAVEWSNVKKGYVVIRPDNRSRKFFVDLQDLDEAERRRAAAGRRVRIRPEVIRAEKSAITLGRVTHFEDGGGATLALPAESASAHADAETIRQCGVNDLTIGDSVVVKYKNIQDALIAIDISRPKALKTNAPSLGAASIAIEAGTVFDRCVVSRESEGDSSTSKIAMRLLERIEQALDDMNNSISASFGGDPYER